ncbi:Rieske 2Fe-2S domain-containing protein [Uliginosibacterium sp. H3]|uniref:Rieske 2Fe-2S domain-containing protein n=1 Tax=Uliginosibacterium silvisoli TaxID=3114758 RepID=A0ABU6K439_9RHOO|nr:Rieske 2Fe-2S domain-containing protein [Uliginosibacterium sp. H3]
MAVSESEMAELNERVVCESGAVTDGGDGVVFSVRQDDEDVPAFVIRHEGVAHAYVNRCRHIPVELDWMPGRFFDDEGVYLVCATHGALYEPASGRCAGGPCSGRGLEPVSVEERDGHIYLKVMNDREGRNE